MNLAPVVMLLLAADEPSPPPSPWLKASEVVTATVSGVQSGWLIGTLLTTSPTRLAMDFPSYVTFQQEFIRQSRPVGPKLIPIAVVSNAVPLWLDWGQWHRSRFWLNAVGLLCNVLVGVAAVAFNVPAIGQLESWSASQVPPANWMAVRDQWETGYLLQTIFSTGAFVVTTAAVADF